MKAMKIAAVIGGTVFVAYVTLLLAQLWFEPMAWSLFWKWTVTAGVLLVAVFGVALLYREYVEEKTQRDEKYLD